MPATKTLESLDLRPVHSPFVADEVAEHLVFVLTGEERRLFFRDESVMNFPGVRHTLVDISPSGEDFWEDILRDLNPTVLVAAWHCPPLPLNWVRSENCSLRYYCGVTGSVKPSVPREVFERDILVSNWGDVISYTVAEHALLMVLACLRNTPLWPELITRPCNLFKKAPILQSRSLRGKRVGLHGFGAVARELVAMLKPHRVELAAYSAGVPQACYQAHDIHACASLEELFSRSDILIEVEGLNAHSRHSVTAEILARLPQDAVFVNVGRGWVVDEAALAHLARSGRIRVGLDVFQREPLPPDSPLRDHPAILLSPHVAGPTGDTYQLCGQQALDNLQRYFNGQTPHHLVTQAIFDRAT